MKNRYSLLAGSTLQILPNIFSVSAPDVNGLPTRNYADPKLYLFDRSGIVCVFPPPFLEQWAFPTESEN